MKMILIRTLLLHASFGMALNLCSMLQQDSQGNANSTPKARTTTRQGDDAPNSSSPPLRGSVSTGNVQCDQNWFSTQSKDLISPAGVSASVELRGKTLVGKTADDNRCETTWILHVAGQGDPQSMVVDTRDDEWYCEHIFEINGWSRDGTLLLMSQIVAAGDWDQTTPIVYDMQNHRILLIELAPLFDKFAPKDCSLYFRPMGFTSSGGILISVGSFDESDPAPGEKPCFQSGRWELDYFKKHVGKVSNTAAFERFGTVSGKSSSSARD